MGSWDGRLEMLERNFSVEMDDCLHGIWINERDRTGAKYYRYYFKYF